MKKEIVSIASITPIDERAMTRSVIARADSSISELEARLSSSNQLQQNSVQELGSLPRDKMQRDGQRDQAKQNISKIDNELGKTTAMAKLYQDTPLEQSYRNAVSGLRDQLEQAQGRLQQISQTCHDADKKAAERKAELETLCTSLNPEIVAIQDELKHMRSGRLEARRTLAEQEHAATLQAYDEHNKRIEEIEADLAEAKQNRQAFVKESINKFAEYRDLNANVRGKLLLEDQHTRQLEGYIAFLEAFKKDRTLLTRQLPVSVPMLAPSHLDNWTQLFSFAPVDWYYEDWRRPEEPKVLNQRISDLKGVLVHYRIWLAEER